MADYRTGYERLLAKLKTTSGQDAGPTVGADAVLTAEPVRKTSGRRARENDGC